MAKTQETPPWKGLSPPNWGAYLATACVHHSFTRTGLNHWTCFVQSWVPVFYNHSHFYTIAFYPQGVLPFWKIWTLFLLFNLREEILMNILLSHVHIHLWIPETFGCSPNVPVSMILVPHHSKGPFIFSWLLAMKSDSQKSQEKSVFF